MGGKKSIDVFIGESKGQMRQFILGFIVAMALIAAG